MIPSWRMMANGTPVDLIDDLLALGHNTIIS
jgi:hypothetical protein